MMAKAPSPPPVPVDDAARRTLMRTPTRPEGAKSISPDELRARMVKEVLNSPLPADNSRQLEIPQDSQMTLPVTEILPYDRNPRKRRNDEYDAIKASIQATKRLTSPLVVTRRPGQDKYMVGKGGNTRLSALQELYAETGDSAFLYVVVTYVPWESESATLAAHLVENELRGEMIFWDKANAYAEMKRLIETESGSHLSARALEQALKARGLPLGRAILGYFAFAVEQLSALGDATSTLSIPKVRELQPAFLATERLMKHAQQHDAWAAVRDPALRGAEQAWLVTGELDIAKIVEALDQSVATLLGEPVEIVRLTRDLGQRIPNEDCTSLLAQARLQRQPALPDSRSPQADLQIDSTVVKPASTRAAASPIPVAIKNGQASPLRQVQELATHFARMNQVADCLRLSAAWPTGFYMEIPENDEPIDLTVNGADRYYGWWMLAMLSQQLDDAWSGLMPEDSTWRQAQRQEHGRDEYALQHYMDTILGMPIDPLSLGKRLLLGLDSIALWLDLVRAVSSLRVGAAERFAVKGDTV